MHDVFDWPTPPHFEHISSEAANDAPAAAVVVLNNGRGLTGNLIRFDPAAAAIDFHVENAAANISLGFPIFQSLRLTQSIELRRIRLPAAAASVEVHPVSERQKCVVIFKNGGNLISDTVGVVCRQYGLFLFLANYSNNLLRWFIPSDAIASYQIGDQLGKILVDQQILSASLVDAGLEKQRQLRSQKLGEYLTSQNIVTREQLSAALEKHKKLPHLRLGEAMVQEKLITQKQLDDALQMQAKDRKTPLGEILTGMGLVNEETVKRVLVEKLGIPYVNLRQFQFDNTVIKSLRPDLVHKHAAVPLYRTELHMVVAMVNPLAWETLQELGFFLGLKIDPVMASADDLAFVIERFYGPSANQQDLSELVSELGVSEEMRDASSNDIVTESDTTLVRLVNKIILDAFEQGVSDIHIESMRGNRSSRVRFRKDGVMAHYSEIPAQFRNALVSRIKIMSRLDISEKRQSQDGKINFEQFGPAKIELRVVTMPTTEGLEDVVMRILAAPKAVPLDGLGLTPQVLAQLQSLAAKPHGLLFVCGPTGSGKTTTLHSLLSYINTPERKVWTVEDPIEITQEGLRQVQTQAKIGRTFAAVLRSFLRADPDVIMVGETRDPETAKTVIEASLTGHLVLSTMHTNSAAESVVRLLDLGMDPFNFSDALLGVVGQRLARRLCSACRKPHAASQEEIDVLLHEYCLGTELNAAQVLEQWRTQYANESGTLTLFSADGCDTCERKGYKGRLGVHEFLLASIAVKKKIQSSASVAEILKVAVDEGMRTLRQDGIGKILQGHTDLKQIKAVCL